jgi:hypothetical protein
MSELAVSPFPGGHPVVRTRHKRVVKISGSAAARCARTCLPDGQAAGLAGGLAAEGGRR